MDHFYSEELGYPLNIVADRSHYHSTDALTLEGMVRKLITIGQKTGQGNPESSSKKALNILTNEGALAIIDLLTSRKCNAEILGLILNSGFEYDLSQQDEQGEAALSAACTNFEKSYLKLINMLLDRGANVWDITRYGEQETTVIESLIRVYEVGDGEVIHVDDSVMTEALPLIFRHKNFDFPEGFDEERKGALIAILGRCVREIANPQDLIRELGYDPDFPNKSPHPELIRCLINRIEGAANIADVERLLIETDDISRELPITPVTPLSAAVDACDVRSVEFLLKEGSNPNVLITGIDGVESILHRLCGSLKTRSDYLESQGAQGDSLTDERKLFTDQTEIACLLIAHGANLGYEVYLTYLDKEIAEIQERLKNATIVPEAEPLNELQSKLLDLKGEGGDHRDPEEIKRCDHKIWKCNNRIIHAKKRSELTGDYEVDEENGYSALFLRQQEETLNLLLEKKNSCQHLTETLGTLIYSIMQDSICRQVEQIGDLKKKIADQAGHQEDLLRSLHSKITEKDSNLARHELTIDSLIRSNKERDSTIKSQLTKITKQNREIDVVKANACAQKIEIAKLKEQLAAALTTPKAAPTPSGVSEAAPTPSDRPETSPKNPKIASKKTTTVCTIQ